MARKPAGAPVTVAEIAGLEGLTNPYVGKLMAALRQAGFVDSVRGRGGGYVLARPATEITLEQILRALGGPVYSTKYCEEHPGALEICTHSEDCSIRPIWQTLGEIISQVLRGTSLADLCQQEERLATRFRDSMPTSIIQIATSKNQVAAPAAPVGALPPGGGPVQS